MALEITKGQIVKSTAGRDKGRFFIVLGIEGPYVWLADGKVRKVQTPKKKKRIHIAPTKIQVEILESVMGVGLGLAISLTNRKARELLWPYNYEGRYPDDE